MLDVYANWIEGTDRSEIAAIEPAMQRSPAIWHQRGTSAEWFTQPLKRTRKYVAERESISVDLPSRSTLFHSGLLSEFKNLIR